MNNNEKDIIFVLIEVFPGHIEEVIRELKKIDNVVEVNAVTGVFDIIIKIEDTNINKAIDTVVHEIRAIESIKNTETLITLKM